MKAAIFATFLTLVTLSSANAQAGNSVCAGAIDLNVDEVVEGSVQSGEEEAWYSITGTDERLTTSTCTGEATLDSIAFDSIITVYSGDCNNLELVISDDDGGVCGNLKSQTGWQPDADTIYYIRVTGYGGAFGAFGLTVFPSTQTQEPVTLPPYTQPPESLCENGVALALDEVAEGETSSIGTWFSFIGTGGDLLVTTCTGNNGLDNSSFDSVITLYAKGCNDLRYIASDDEGGKCGNGKSAIILPSVEDLTYYINVYEYSGSTGSFGIKVSEIA